MRERKEKAHGPYRRGRKWRVVETSATGARATCSFASEALALAYIADFNDEAEGRTVSGVIDVYLEHLETKGLKQSSRTTLSFRLKAITDIVKRDRLLSAVTPTIADELYQARVAKRKPDTHRAELAAVTAMFAWCVKKGWLLSNPFAGVDPIGRKSVRRDHLRIDEARAYRKATLADLSDGALAASIALLMGLRATEIVKLAVRDIDDSARVIWIFESKTEAGDRHLEVPGELRSRLARKVANRDGDEYIFGDVDRRWVRYHVERIGQLAKISRPVTPHMLRRTWSALAAEAVPVDAVSRALGHASSTITRRHYQPTNAEERRSGQTVQRTMETSGELPVSGTENGNR